MRYQWHTSIDNFDQVVCGGFRSSHDITPHRLHVDLASELEDQSGPFLDSILASPFPVDGAHFKENGELIMYMAAGHYEWSSDWYKIRSDYNNYVNLQRYYNSCVEDTTFQSEADAHDLLMDFLFEIHKPFDAMNTLRSNKWWWRQLRPWFMKQSAPDPLDTLDAFLISNATANLAVLDIWIFAKYGVQKSALEEVWLLRPYLQASRC